MHDSKRAKVKVCKTLRPRLWNVHNVTSATSMGQRKTQSQLRSKGWGDDLYFSIGETAKYCVHDFQSV